MAVLTALAASPSLLVASVIAVGKGACYKMMAS